MTVSDRRPAGTQVLVQNKLPTETHKFNQIFPSLNGRLTPAEVGKKIPFNSCKECVKQSLYSFWLQDFFRLVI